MLFASHTQGMQDMQPWSQYHSLMKHTNEVLCPRLFMCRRPSISCGSRKVCGKVASATACQLHEQVGISNTSRRQAMQTAMVALIAQQSMPAWAAERRGMSRYIKKKALDPLETYVPAVIQAREQLVDAGKLMDQDPIEARIRLRSSAFEGLRDTVRALGEYATSNNVVTEMAAKDLVNKTFGTIQDFDFQLFSATKYKQPVSKEAEMKLQQAVRAMDDLLATVPADSMSKAREVLKAIESRALARSDGDAVKAFDGQRLEGLVPEAS